MIQDLVHKNIVDHLQKVEDWFRLQSEGLFFPFYSSFDIRDSGFKIAPVDANIFPAGFNNICPTDQDSAEELVLNYFKSHYPNFKKIVLLTEEHTNNPYYWDNAHTLWRLLTSAGLEVKMAIPRALPEPLKLVSASGREVSVFSAERIEGKVIVDGMTADLIISNNDFSEAYQEWVSGLETPINPPHQLGWHARRKDQFFREYNQLAQSFARLIDVDPWLLEVQTEAFTEFDINDEASRNRLAERVDGFLAAVREQYQQRQINVDPFTFIKNNSGTYGLGVTQVNSGDEVRQWSYKSRKKMKAAKGGRSIEQVIIQEGIPTIVTSQGATAEPTIYMVGCKLAGGFLRTHEAKSPRESLNSPGAVFRRLCVSDLRISVEGHPMENVYGWIARLSFLAIAREARNHKITCPQFKSCR